MQEATLYYTPQKYNLYKPGNTIAHRGHIIYVYSRYYCATSNDKQFTVRFKYID